MVDFNAKYPFMTAYLKGEEAKLITPAHIDKLMRARDIPEAVEIIKDTDIGNYLDSVLMTTFDEADRALWFYIDNCLDRIAHFNETPGAMQKLINAYVIKYDVLNAKSALSAMSTEKKAGLIPLGTMYKTGWLTDLAGARETETVALSLQNSGLKDYAEIVRGYPAAAKPAERLSVETALDRLYYHDLLRAARRVGDSSFLVQAVGTLMDMRNLRIALRGLARQTAPERSGGWVGDGFLLTAADIQKLTAGKIEDAAGMMPYAYQKLVQEVVTSYGKTRNIIAVDEIINRFEFGALRDLLSPRIMSPAMIIWYLILKETEVRNMRLVIRAIFDNVPLEEIREYLVVTV